MNLRAVLRELLVVAWSLAVLARCGMLSVGGMGAGINRRDLSALDVVGHSVIVAARARNLPLPRIKQVLTVAGTLGEIVDGVVALKSPSNLKWSILREAPEESLKWVNSLERDPVLKKLLSKPQVDVALPVCAMVVFLGSLFSRLLPREASLAVAMAASLMVIVAQQVDPTAKASLGLQYVVMTSVASALL